MFHQGMHIYSQFDKVVVLQRCHRVRQKEGANLTQEDHDYNARGQRFLSVVTRLRDCTWTEKDYYWLCKRKMSQLSLSARAAFQDAPVIIAFR